MKNEEQQLLQALFDRVVLALRKQGRPSVSSITAGCRYRGDAGARCAVGHLIDDAIYDDELEGRPVRDSAVAEALDKSFGRALTAREVDLLAWLQSAHDTPWIDHENSYDSDDNPDGVPLPDKEWLAKFLDRAQTVAGVYQLGSTALWAKIEEN